jgi:hypothetical protein
VGAIVGFGWLNRDVIGAFETDDMRGFAGDSRVTAAIGIRDKRYPEFGTCVGEGR